MIAMHEASNVIGYYHRETFGERGHALIMFNHRQDATDVFVWNDIEASMTRLEATSDVLNAIYNKTLFNKLKRLKAAYNKGEN